jgi:hypothetical protein
MLLIFSHFTKYPDTSTTTLKILCVFLAITLAVVFAPWMAGYTESVEAKNPALVGTGLALWGWIIRVVVGISFIFLPVVINTVNPIVDNLPVSQTVINGQSIADWAASPTGKAALAFAQEHQALLVKVNSLPASVQAGLSATPPTTTAIVYATKAIGLPALLQLNKLSVPFHALVIPNKAELAYAQAHQSELTALQDALAKTPEQWRHWFYIDLAGMIVFIPLIWLTKGRWNPAQAKRDAEEHERRVNEELARLLAEEQAQTTTA